MTSSLGEVLEEPSSSTLVRTYFSSNYQEFYYYSTKQWEQHEAHWLYGDNIHINDENNYYFTHPPSQTPGQHKLPIIHYLNKKLLAKSITWHISINNVTITVVTLTFLRSHQTRAPMTLLTEHFSYSHMKITILSRTTITPSSDSILTQMGDAMLSTTITPPRVLLNFSPVWELAIITHQGLKDLRTYVPRHQLYHF
jgi:hypothetical protein